MQSPSDHRHHAENFPVASWLCPARLRPPILAIYRFARAADDVADEGDAPTAARQWQLAQLRSSLRRCAVGAPLSPDEQPLFEPLGVAIREFNLPTSLLDALLDAFEQDTRIHRYADRDQLLHYCQRSANPVGRLLLHLVNVHSPEALRASDAICTGLQLVNFWQDIRIDRLKGRVYLPETDLAHHGLTVESVLLGSPSPALRACIADLTAWAVELLESGRSLPRQVPGRLGWELRWVIEGGLRIAEKIRHLEHDTLTHRPRLSAGDAPLLLARALRNRLRHP
ncbi:squalene synthase HpnC [Inhella gelatinilytica]|uniref:squalene synthase HpnC n=1 Tax=Inhella gelatinilytica TaxID=2795030 RepID=UPI002872D5B9|nr:squalene synthase HpnC [Inhella gelatinilytica]